MSALPSPAPLSGRIAPVPVRRSLLRAPVDPDAHRRPKGRFKTVYGTLPAHGKTSVPGIVRIGGMMPVVLAHSEYHPVSPYLEDRRFSGCKSPRSAASPRAGAWGFSSTAAFSERKVTSPAAASTSNSDAPAGGAPGAVGGAMRFPRCYVLGDILVVRRLGTAAGHSGEFHRLRVNERPGQAACWCGMRSLRCRPRNNLPTTLRGAVKIHFTCARMKRAAASGSMRPGPGLRRRRAAGTIATTAIAGMVGSRLRLTAWKTLYNADQPDAAPRRVGRRHCTAHCG